MALLITRRVKLRSLTTLTFSYTVALYPFISIEKALLKVGFILMALAFIFLLYAISKIRVGSISLPTDNLLAYFKKQNQTQLSHNWGEKFASLKKTYNFNVYEWLLVLVITLLILYFLHRVSYVSISSTLIASFLIAIVTTHLKQTNKFMLPLLYFSIYYFVGFNGVRSEVIADACSILLLAIIVYTRDKHEILLSLITYLALSLALGVMSNEIPWNMLKFLVATGAVWMTDFKHTKSVISIAGLIILLIALDEFWRGGWSLVEIAANHVSDFLLLGTLFFIAVKKHVYATYLPYTILLIIVLSNPYTREELQIVPKSSAVVVVRETVNSLSESADFSIGPKEKDRPLHYVEAPVLENESEATKLGTSLGILLKYLKMTLLPYPMAFYYGYAEISPIEISNPIAIISIIIFTSLLITAFATIKKSPVVSLGLFTYLLSLAVFSSYQLYVPGMFADRNLFTPTIGFSIVLGGISWELERRTSKISGFITAKKMWNASLLFMIMAYSLVTVNRNFDWKDDLTLFRHDIKHVDKSAQAHNLLGLHLMQHTQTAVSQAIQQDLTREALFHFKKAQEIFPNFFNVAYDIGRVYLALNEPDSAIIAFEQALAIDSITLPSIHIQLADLYTQQRDSVSANKHLLSYIMLAPTDYSGYNKLSYLLYMDKRYSESIAVNKRAILNIPNLIDPYINIAYTFRGMKNVDSALYYLRIAERIDPTNQNVQQGIRELTENIPSTSR
jgi:tetratricopeptide (TPR) repeat protein